jgi:hypothetical protein
MAALLKSAESKDFVGSNPTLSANEIEVPVEPAPGRVRSNGTAAGFVRHLPALQDRPDGAWLHLSAV